MRLLFMISVLFFYQTTFSQANQESYRQQRDSMIAAASSPEKKEKARIELSSLLQTKLDIPKRTADSLLIICEHSVADMQMNARNKSISNDEKTKRFKAIANERDKRLADLLPQDKLDRAMHIVSGKEK